MPIFLFRDDNLSKSQGILIKLAIYIDIKEIWFGIANGLIAIICLCIKVIVAKISGKKITQGQITILDQILIIPMDR